MRNTNWFLLFLVIGSVNSFAQEFTIDNLIVGPIDRIDVPARVTGLLKKLNVNEGDLVATGQSLASLDDDHVTIETQLAQVKIQISREIAEGSHDLQLAQKEIQRSNQTAKLRGIANEMAQRKAANNIRVRAAEKAEAVASNELSRASQARQAFVDSVSRSEIDGLTLAFQRSQLETKQASFELEIDSLLAQSEETAIVEQKLAVDQAMLRLESTQADRAIAALELQATVKAAELAALMMKQHRVESPIDGVVTRVIRRPGQWVKAGEPVIEVLRLNRLRAEGFVNQAVADKLRSSPKISLQSDAPDAKRLTAKVSFVMPEVDPVNGDVRFWVEFDNPQHVILPGMKVAITVTP